MNSPLISAQQLTKNFGKFPAVQGIDFDIQPGECFGFLGPNGAGKSSTMRMIYCFSKPSGGSLRVFGQDVTCQERAIKARLGVVPQEDNLDPDLSVRQNLHLFATYFDLSQKEAARRTEELLVFVSLEEKAEQKITTLSGGMRRRLLIARALINKPQILILDEPTTGLDPQARHIIWHKLRMLKQSGVTMVLTTHYMEEAERLCDRLVVMDHGKILSQGAPEELVKTYAGKEVLEVRGEVPDLRALKAQIEQTLQAAAEDTFKPTLELVADTLYIRLQDRALKFLDLFPQIHQTDFFLRPANLEDVFLHLTGRDLRD